MAFPIRFKLINKETGEQVKGVKGLNVDGVKSAVLLPDGTPAIWSVEFYEYVKPVSCSDYELHVATEKVNDEWLYKQVGF